MNYQQVYQFCREHGIENWKNGYQSVRYHNKKETRRHFQSKGIIAFEIMKKGGSVLTEVDLGMGVADILWVEVKIVIELESRLTKKNLNWKRKQYKDWNLFVFDLKTTTIDEILTKIGLKR